MLTSTATTITFPSGRRRELSEQTVGNIVAGLNSAIAHSETFGVHGSFVDVFAGADAVAGTLTKVTRSAPLGVTLHLADGNSLTSAETMSTDQAAHLLAELTATAASHSPGSHRDDFWL